MVSKCITQPQVSKMSFIQRYGRCIYAKVTPEPNKNSLEEKRFGYGIRPVKVSL